MLKIKELEHKIARFHKDSRDATQKVSKTPGILLCPRVAVKRERPLHTVAMYCSSAVGPVAQ